MDDWDDAADFYYDVSDGEEMDYELQIALQASLHDPPSPKASLRCDQGAYSAVSSSKGRRKYMEDLEKLKRLWEKGFVVKTVKVFAPKLSEDAETIEVTILLPNSQRIELDLIISDTTEYPGEHTFFWCAKSEVPDELGIPKVFEDLSSFVGLSIQAIIEKFLASIVARLPQRESPDASDSDGSEDGFSLISDCGSENYDPSDNDEGEIPGFSEDEDDTGLTKTMLGGRTKYTHLQAHFNELVANSFRPGFIPRSSDTHSTTTPVLSGWSSDFGLTISCPVTQLLDIIPARALMAWDPCLLSRGQHLTLCISGFRGVYPPLDLTSNTYTTSARILGSKLQFKVGLVTESNGYKVGVEEFWQAFGEVKSKSTPEPDGRRLSDEHEEEDDKPDKVGELQEVVQEKVLGKLQPFSLSVSLESHLNQALVRLVSFRRQFNLSWAGAEVLLSYVDKTQKPPEEIFSLYETEIRPADLEESELRRACRVPEDIFAQVSLDADTNSFNFPLVAFSYLLRRLALCTRHCVVCHNRLPPSELMHEALKPYVCGENLCTYQYYHLNLGLPLEYEIINNASAVDLLVSFAHLAASNNILDDPLPIGMALYVPRPGQNVTLSLEAYRKPNHELTLFDSLSKPEMRQAIRQLIELLPSIQKIKESLEQQIKEGASKPRLQNVDSDVPEAAWLILRWCVASCTAYLEEITSPEDTIPEFDTSQSWRQFRFSVGSPAAEGTFQKSLSNAQQRSAQAKLYPSVYAFHGSPLHNWHSIIRNGLWYRTIAHGRAYGNGVYFAGDGQVSMSHYAQAGMVTWSNSMLKPQKCMALAELVNLPHEFQESRACYVVQHTEWIMCRYLLIQGSTLPSSPTETTSNNPRPPAVRFDPQYPTSYGGKPITIPDPSHKLSALVSARKSEYTEPEYDEYDLLIFNYTPLAPSAPSNPHRNDNATTSIPIRNGVDDWTPDPSWLNKHIKNLIPASYEASPSATRAIQMELASIIREQEAAPRLDQLGWYIPQDLVEDNLFRWIVELHSFDPDLPLAKDMKYRDVNSLVFEIRFPPNFPNDPPFFRLLGPRLLAFSEGGGGHVTTGGSICMDLLTSSNWRPVYRIPAVLLQVRLALSNREPKPARLASNWSDPYTIQEAREGYLRAARNHGWEVPKGLANFVG